MPALFMYGPDTFRARVFDRIGSCDVLGAATLGGYSLVFNKPNMKNKAEGFANLAEDSEGALWGVVFEMTEKQLETLEGYFGGYTRKSGKATLRKQQADADVSFFVARRTGRNLGPSAATLDLTLRGAEENGLPRDFIDHIKTLKALDE